MLVAQRARGRHLGADEVLAFEQQQQNQTDAYEKQALRIYGEKE